MPARSRFWADVLLSRHIFVHVMRVIVKKVQYDSTILKSSTSCGMDHMNITNETHDCSHYIASGTCCCFQQVVSMGRHLIAPQSPLICFTPSSPPTSLPPGSALLAVLSTCSILPVAQQTSKNRQPGGCSRAEATRAGPAELQWCS